MTESFPKRGVYRLPPLAVISRFPFGMFERRRRFIDHIEVVVYPRVQALRTTAIERLPGGRVAPRVPTGEGDEFFCLREYVRGDDLRRIAWRASARLGSLVVKEMTHAMARFAVFVLDTHQPEDLDHFEQRFEDAVELVASLAVTLLNQEFTVAVATPGHCLREGKGKAHVIKVLDVLARVQPSIYPDERDVEAFAMERGPEARLVFVSPDPRRWGQRTPFGGSTYLDAREVLRA